MENVLKDLIKRVERIEAILSDYRVCNCCGCVYHDSYVRQQKCPACGEGVS
jgi:rubrerythrin